MQLLKNFYEKYFELNLSDYPNIAVNFEINKVIAVLFLGLCVASVFISIRQSKISLLLRKLMRAEAYSTDTAKKLSELNLTGNRGIYSIITSSNGVISKLIAVVGQKRLTYEEYVALEKKKRDERKLPPQERSEPTNTSYEFPGIDDIRVYIPESQRDYATHFYEMNTASPIKTALGCLFIIAIAVALILLMPSLLSALNNILSK